MSELAFTIARLGFLALLWFFVFLIIQLVLNFLRLAALSIELLDQCFTFFDIRAIHRENGGRNRK